MSKFKIGDLYLVNELTYDRYCFVYLIITKISSDNKITYHHSHGSEDKEPDNVSVERSMFEDFIRIGVIELVNWSSALQTVMLDLKVYMC